MFNIEIEGATSDQNGVRTLYLIPIMLKQSEQFEIKFWRTNWQNSPKFFFQSVEVGGDSLFENASVKLIDSNYDGLIKPGKNVKVQFIPFIGVFTAIITLNPNELRNNGSGHISIHYLYPATINSIDKLIDIRPSDTSLLNGVESVNIKFDEIIVPLKTNDILKTKSAL